MDRRVGPRQAGALRRRAQGQHDEERAVGEALRQVREQISRRAVEPVGVFHPEQRRVAVHAVFEQGAQQGELLLLDEGLRSLRIRRRAAQAEQPGHDLHLLRRRRVAEGLEEPGDLHPPLGLAVLGRQAGAGPEHAGGGVERRVGEDLQAVRLQGAGALGFRLGAEFRHQPRLADPGLADDVDGPGPVLAAGVVPEAQQFAQRRVAADEVGGAAPGPVPVPVGRRTQPQDAVHEHDPRQAADRLRAQRLGVEQAVHQLQRFPAHHHGAGRRVRLQTGSEVDRLADRAVAACRGLGGVRPDHHLPGVQADADGKGRLARSAARRRQARHALRPVPEPPGFRARRPSRGPSGSRRRPVRRRPGTTRRSRPSAR